MGCSLTLIRETDGTTNEPEGYIRCRLASNFSLEADEAPSHPARRRRSSVSEHIIRLESVKYDDQQSNLIDSIKNVLCQRMKLVRRNIKRRELVAQHVERRDRLLGFEKFQKLLLSNKKLRLLAKATQGLEPRPVEEE
jgi:hypothetical protein